MGDVRTERLPVLISSGSGTGGKVIAVRLWVSKVKLSRRQMWADTVLLGNPASRQLNSV